MTASISTRSTRYAAAQRFGVELTRVMAKRKVGRRRLAAVLGMRSSSIIAHWRSGNGLPRVDQAVRLTEALDAPILLTIVESVRMGKCENCAKPFLNEGGGPKRYCSELCRKVKAKVRAGSTPRLRAAVAERRLADHRVAVEAMCHACEPDGHCHDRTCALRPVSPLPLITMALVEEATPAPGPWGSSRNRTRSLAGIRAGNARRWDRPGERERQSARTTELHRSGVLA